MKPTNMKIWRYLMMREDARALKLPKSDVQVTFRLPIRVQRILANKARREDLNFSQLVRRALRREIATNGIFEERNK
jgi:hypothetical protein